MGEYQNSFGASACKRCDPGSITATTGSTECVLCRLGEFANASGMSSCFACGNETGQQGLWTTSQEAVTNAGSQIIQVQGATSSAFCACAAQSFLLQGRCHPCTDGATCIGDNRLRLWPGYFSSVEAPHEIYKCEQPNACPGGLPGTCSQGRGVGSVACEACLHGLRSDADGSCKPCNDHDYLLLLLLATLVVLGVAVLYCSLLKKGQANRNRHFLVAVQGLSQLLTIVQMLAVIRRFKIAWGEPFATVLVYVEVLSFDLEMLSLSCLAAMGPLQLFAFRVLMIPGIMTSALLIHMTYHAYLRARGASRASFGFRHFLTTCGAIFLTFFIILFAMLLAPWKCQGHPNGRFTVQGYPSVLCDWVAVKELKFSYHNGYI